ncbi:hypothetical protein LUZ60_013471 [Juncus effusus]|nr:hypothetical protein LUZ60_013471 [Juncus effusus]
MEYHHHHQHQQQQQKQNPYPYHRRYAPAGNRAPPPPLRWVKEWIPQQLTSNGANCSLFRWVREDMVQTLKDKAKAPKIEELKPEPTTEVLFLCSFEGCGKTFVDVLALRKHANIHGERQYICHYAGCGKKFLDSSKLKRHFLIHTGERDFVCPHEGCGKAFSLDFNLRAHMKTHLAENYHVCPYSDCGKRFTNELKLRTHMKSHLDKNTPPPEVSRHVSSRFLEKSPAEVSRHAPTRFLEKKSPGEVIRHTPNPTRQAEKPHYRPFACPYEGCDKAYIHEYKLNLHLRTNHPNDELNNESSHNNNVNKFATPSPSNVHSANANKRVKGNNLRVRMEVGKTVGGSSLGGGKRVYEEEDEREEDSEETEEDMDENGEGNGEDRWGYDGMERNGDDEETEDED